MRLSRRSEYGLRALIDLVHHQGEGPISLAALSTRNNLPRKFVEQILITLRNGGIVHSSMGAHGGYQLTPGAEKVTLGRIIRLLDGALAPVGCVSLRFYEPCSCPDEDACSLRAVMIDVRDAILGVLDETTLAEAAARPGVHGLDPKGLYPGLVGTMITGPGSGN
jgi:Rrf2 family protein